jgi:CRISPR-associated Csx2 family protein
MVRIEAGGFMSKIFVSFLGTGNYSDCNYIFADKSVNTRFIQEALIQIFCEDFSENDRMCIFLTEDAKNKNWESNEEKKGLKQTLQELHLNLKIKIIDIPIGKSEAEIWDIFNKMFAILQEDDSVIFDITHAFRFQPLLGFVILNYAQYLKNITVNGIYYGAFEAKDADNNTPIFDLKQFYNLMQWSSAADTFVNYGISDKLNKLARENSRNYHGSKETGNSITLITECMSTLRGTEIVEGKIFASCINRVDKLEKDGTYQAAFKPIFSKVKEKLKDFKENDAFNFFYAVKWYMQHDMITQALTMMQEGLLTYIMDRKDIDWKNRDLRECVSGYLIYVFKLRYATSAISENDFFSAEQKRQNNELNLKSNDDVLATAAKVYDDIRQLRNDVNHGGFNKAATPSPRIINKAHELFNALERVCHALSE